jgi:hypothetical protein
MPDAELLPEWGIVSDEDPDFAWELGGVGADTFADDLSALQNIGATYDASALPEEAGGNPEDDLQANA